MFWKRFYFIFILISCSCFFLTCETLCKLFGCGSAETKGNTVSNLNNSHNNEGSFNNKENDTDNFSDENNNNNFENQQRNQYEYTFNNLNNNYNSSNNEDCDIKDSDSLYDNLEDVDFSTLEPSNEQEGLDYDFFSCIFCSATNCAAGKTNIINVANNDKVFDEKHSPTIGVDFTTSYFKTTNNKLIKLQVWEAASKEEYQSIAANYYKGKNAIIFVYDITNKKSLEDLVNFINNVKKKCNENKDNPLFFLLGNKLDLDTDGRQVETEEAKTFAGGNNLIFLGECSARDNKYIPVTGNTCYKEEKFGEGKYCPDYITGIFKDILYNIVKKQKSQGE